MHPLFRCRALLRRKVFPLRPGSGPSPPVPPAGTSSVHSGTSLPPTPSLPLGRSRPFAAFPPAQAFAGGSRGVWRGLASSAGEPHVPSFLETVGEALSSDEGKIFVVTAASLVGAALLGDAILRDHSAHGAEHHSEHDEHKEDPAAVVVVEEEVLEASPEPVDKEELVEVLEPADETGSRTEGEELTAVADEAVVAVEATVEVVDKVGEALESAAVAAVSAAEAVGTAVEAAAEVLTQAAEPVVAAVESAADAVKTAREKLGDAVTTGAAESGREADLETPGTQEDSSPPGGEAAAPPEEQLEELSKEVEASNAAKAEPVECPFCKFMRAGPCGTQFQAWEDCVDSAKEDVVDRCKDPTHELRLCMEEHKDYYSVILEAEKMIDAEKRSEEGSGGDPEVVAEAVVVTETVPAVETPSETEPRAEAEAEAEAGVGAKPEAATEAEGTLPTEESVAQQSSS